MAKELSTKLLWSLQHGALLRQSWNSAMQCASPLSNILSNLKAGKLAAMQHTQPHIGQLRGYAGKSYPEHQLLNFPSLSPTMSQGNIVEWKKQVGDSVAPGDLYCEVETDKATIAWEAQEDGFIAKILLPNGAKEVPVGTPAVVLVEEKGNVSAFEDFSPTGAAAGSASKSEPAPAKSEPAPSSKPAPAAAAPAKKPAAAQSFPPHEMLTFPALSPTMSQGNILEWKKQVGDSVAPGDVYCEVETDKATISWEAQEEGFIAKILLPGAAYDVPVGAPALVLVEDKAQIDAFKNFTADAAQGGEAAASEPEAPPPQQQQPSSHTQQQQQAAEPQQAASAQPSSSGDRVRASPYARKLAAQQGLGLQGVTGSGPGGRIVAADVKQAAASGKAKAPAPGVSAAAGMESGASYVDIPHSQIRRVTAQRLLESKQTIPHYYLTVEVQVDQMLKLREQINASFGKDSGTKISVNDFVIKAAALALKKVPGVNASWQKDFIRQYNNVDMSVAVQTPVGLLTPIVKDAHAKGLAAISADVKTLAKKAKDGKLAPNEFIGGTFTISNLGMYGVKQFAAIVNPPQAAILAVGGTDKKVVKSKTGEYSEVSVMTVTMSCDHRVIDGAMGAEWLQAFKGYLESPYTMLL